MVQQTSDAPGCGGRKLGATRTPEYFFFNAEGKLVYMGLPVVLVYLIDGTEAYRLTGDDPDSQFNDEDVESAVLSLLGRQTGQGAGVVPK